MLPYPLSFATSNTKANAKAASEDICKLCCVSVEYFRGHCPTVLTDRQTRPGTDSEGRGDSLGGDIGDVYVEAFDASTQDVIRALSSRSTLRWVRSLRF
jgi:hypothetical protein